MNQTLRVETAYCRNVRHGYERDYNVPLGALPISERRVSVSGSGSHADWELSYWVPNP